MCMRVDDYVDLHLVLLWGWMSAISPLRRRKGKKQKKKKKKKLYVVKSIAESSGQSWIFQFSTRRLNVSLPSHVRDFDSE